MTRLLRKGNAAAAAASGIVTASWVRTQSGLANIGLAERLDVVSVDDGFICEAVWNDGTSVIVWRGKDEAAAWAFVDGIAKALRNTWIAETSRVRIGTG